MTGRLVLAFALGLEMAMVIMPQAIDFGSNAVDGTIENSGDFSQAQAVQDIRTGNACAGRIDHVKMFDCKDEQRIIEPAQEALGSSGHSTSVRAQEPGDLGEAQAVAQQMLDDHPVGIRQGACASEHGVKTVSLLDSPIAILVGQSAGWVEALHGSLLDPGPEGRTMVRVMFGILARAKRLFNVY